VCDLETSRIGVPYIYIYIYIYDISSLSVKCYELCLRAPRTEKVFARKSVESLRPCRGPAEECWINTDGKD